MALPSSTTICLSKQFAMRLFPPLLHPPLPPRNWILRLLLPFHPSLAPHSSQFHLLLCCTPSPEGWEVCLASWLGNRFSCGQKYDYGVERSGTLLSPGLIGCSLLPTGPALFVNGKRVMGILCRIVLRGTIIVASEAVFIGLSLYSRRIPVIFGEQKPVVARVVSWFRRISYFFIFSFWTGNWKFN